MTATRLDFSGCGGGTRMWLKVAWSKNLPLSGPLLVEKAVVFAPQLNHDDFVCSKKLAGEV
ncbi:hypothetical protein HPB49_026661 [Dermacentor silvarum]|nr:hypothetical protein HPB49_026661 [Dermacentor silvarum]